MKLFKTVVAASVLAAVSVSAQAANLSIVSGAVGGDIAELRAQLDVFEKETGHKVDITAMPPKSTDQFQQYALWLSQKNNDIDLYRTDVIWAPQLSEHLLDLTEATKDVVGDHFPAIIESQTVDGKLVALPLFTDAPALYYRKDLLEKYDQSVPSTWADMASAAKVIMDGEREAGNNKFFGFVFQGNAYEGLTCNALEWVKSSGGGQVVEADGTISINNDNAAAALDMAASWVGSIAPNDVVTFAEEDSRGVWQEGNAAFMRNWPYAYALGNSDDSKVQGKFEVAPLPSVEGAGSAATLGGWNIAVSKYSKEPEAAVELAKFLANAENQKERAVESSRLPTLVSLYDDADIAEQQPAIVKWKDIFLNAVPRPSAPTQAAYNEVSTVFFTEANAVLNGEQSGAEAVKNMQMQMEEVAVESWLQ